MTLIHITHDCPECSKRNNLIVFADELHEYEKGEWIICLHCELKYIIAVKIEFRVYNAEEYYQ